MTGTPNLDLHQAVADQEDLMIELRRQFHEVPELGFEESKTTKTINEVANSAGLEQLRCPTSTGAIWKLSGSKPGKTVLLRADIDALPIQEDSLDTAHSSVDHVMHACGHDAHTAQLLGAASAMASHRDQLAGKYIFLFQPAEEGLGGAMRMIDGGVLEDIRPEFVLGCHVTSVVPVGIVGIRNGITMAGVQPFRIDLRGAGGHGAMPGEGLNPLTAGAQIALELEGIVEGLSLEGTKCTCTAGALHAGDAPNVIPSHAQLTGTLRTFTEEHFAITKKRFEELLMKYDEMPGLDIALTITDHAAPVVNNPGAADIVRSAALGVVGPSSVFEMPPVSPSDDVSEFLKRVPGAYFFVGAGRDDGTSGMHHSPQFSIDERCMKIAAQTLVDSALIAAAS
jgi:amidohydrolase